MTLGYCYLQFKDALKDCDLYPSAACPDGDETIIQKGDILLDWLGFEVRDYLVHSDLHTTTSDVLSHVADIAEEAARDLDAVAEALYKHSTRLESEVSTNEVAL